MKRVTACNVIARSSASPPLTPAAYYELYNDIQNIDDAAILASRIGDIERLIAVDGDNHQTWAALAEAMIEIGETQKAIEAYLNVRRTGSIYKNYAAHRLAQIYAGAGQRDAALEWLDVALRERRALVRLQRDDAFAVYRDDPEFRRRLGLPGGSVSGREAEWGFDLNLLRREAHRMRFGCDEAAVPDSFDSDIDLLISEVGRRTDDQIWMQARRIVAGISDGHTFVGGPSDVTARNFESRVLPVTFFDFDDGLFIVDAAPEFSHLVGAEVLNLGGLDRGALMAAIDPFVQADNDRTVRYIGAQLGLRRTVFLRELGLADESGEISASVRLANGDVRNTTLPSGDYDVGRKLTPPANLDEPPLYLVRVEDNYWSAPLGKDALYLQINSFRDSRIGASLADFADQVADQTRNVSAVVVDVRHNNGGNAHLSVPLTRALLAFEAASPDHRVFVITSHMSFSATQIFISRLDSLGRPVFVGTPSGASPNFTGEEEPFTLPFSKLSVSFSPLHWQNTSPVDHRKWIEMDVPVAFNGADYVAGRDAALEAIQGILSRGD